jgi:glycosyltransferase involved in cell wall biosynthesis
VITHDQFKFQNPEVESIVEGLTGTFFKYYDLNSLAQILRAWIDSRPEREVIKNNCQEMIVKSYSPENQAKCISNAIKKTLNVA